MSWQSRIDLALEQRREAQALRQRQPLNSIDGRWVEYQGRRYLNFAANDYLGLSHHPAIIAAWGEGARRYGAGSGGSGHVTGYNPAQAEVEQQLAAWLGYEQALLFSSGFAANQALIAALMQKGDRIVADKLSHASLQEAASLSPAELRRFAHNDVAALCQRLAVDCAGQQLVVTEGVFSMDGDRAPLKDISAASIEADAWLMVDDAHGIGVIGDEGRGSCYQAGIHPELLVVTFGKAFGVGGAAILCSQTVADYLLQFARHLIYSTAPPPAFSFALTAALKEVKAACGQRQLLAQHIARLREGVSGLDIRLAPSDTAIQPLIVGDNSRALALARRLREQGIWATAIRPPTVPVGSARLRITLSAAHHAQDIDRLLEVLHDCGE